MDAEFRREMRGSVLGELFEQGLQFGIGSLIGDAGPQADARLERYGRIIREFERQVDIRIADREAGGQNPNDCVILMNKLQVVADDSWIGIEMPLPKTVAQHDHGLRILAIGGV
jgi:hypothetical protein